MPYFTPLNALPKAVKKSNDLLGQEFGYGMGDMPLYAWQWLDDLDQIIAETDESGNPTFDYICQCGKNVREGDHKDWCSRLLIAIARTRCVPVIPGESRKWVFCRWKYPMSRSDWGAMEKTLYNYPENGFYVPVTFDGSPKPYLLLDTEPLPETTLFLIRCIREDRAIDIKEFLRDLEDKHDRNIDRARDHFEDVFKDAQTTFGQIPGTKGHVSYPSVGFGKNAKTVVKEDE